jgi:hypothetical protein
MKLNAEQRDRIRRLLEEELRAAFRSAAARGARPADVAALVADRRRRLAALRPDLADDAQHPADDAGDGGGVGEQR